MTAPTWSPSQVARRLAGRRVWVSRNLRVDATTPVWSVRASVNGRPRVVCRTTAVTLADVECRVRASGRRRALEDGHRNVHAFVVGTVTASGASTDGEFVPVRYDLWDAGAFVDPAGTRVDAATSAVLDAGGLRMLLPTVAVGATGA